MKMLHREGLPSVPLIHVTDRRTFKECRKKFDYAVNQRLAVKDVDADALWFGTGLHLGLGEYYRIGANPVQLWDEYVATPTVSQWKVDPEAVEMGRAMLNGYVVWSEEVDKEWDVVAVEQNLRYEFPNNQGVLTGTVDLLVRWRGALWVVDHKTCRTFPDPRHLELDDQMTAYLWLCRQNNIGPVRGCIYNCLRKKIPSKPKMLVRGELSRTLSGESSYDAYYDAIIENGLNPDHYQEQLDALRSKPSNYFARYEIIRSPKELDEFGIDLHYEMADMSNPETRMYRSPGQACAWCQFQTLCKAEREGSDADFLRQAKYRVRGDDER